MRNVKNTVGNVIPTRITVNLFLRICFRIFFFHFIYVSVNGCGYMLTGLWVLLKWNRIFYFLCPTFLALFCVASDVIK